MCGLSGSSPAGYRGDGKTKRISRFRRGAKRSRKERVLVRHLILPGHVRNSLDALTMLFLEFGSRLPLSIMSQYTPVQVHRFKEMNRRISREEFDRVYGHALELGFERLYVQFLTLSVQLFHPVPHFSRISGKRSPSLPGEGKSPEDERMISRR